MARGFKNRGWAARAAILAHSIWALVCAGPLLWLLMISLGGATGSPSIAAAGFIIFMLCWNEYLFAAALTAERALTLTPWAVGQLSMKEAQVGGEPEEWANLSAANPLMATPALLLAALAQRQIARAAMQAM